MYRLYSQRLKDASGDPEVFIYNEFSERFRNQFITIVKRFFEEIENVDYEARELPRWLCKAFAQEKGLKAVKSIPYNCYIDNNTIEALESYSDACSNDDFLDLMDFVFGAYIGSENMRKFLESRYHPEIYKDAIYELNLRLKQNSLGYEFINGHIIKKTDVVTHENIVKPALKLLLDEEFKGADEEYLLAFEHFRRSENKDAILNATKAFESMMKTICSGMGYDFNPNKDTAKQLLDKLKANSFFPVYLEEHLNAVVKTLETGAPTLRNKTSGHGQGTEVKPIGEEYVEYALNLVASNILLLYRIYLDKKY